MRDKSKYLLFTANDDAVNVKVFYKEEAVWLMRKAMDELFGVQALVVNQHLQIIFESGKLVEDSVVSILETTAEATCNDYLQVRAEGIRNAVPFR